MKSVSRNRRVTSVYHHQMKQFVVGVRSTNGKLHKNDLFASEHPL